MHTFLKKSLLTAVSLFLVVAFSEAANNYQIPGSGGTRNTLKSTDDGTGVQTPHINVDNLGAPSASSTVGLAPVNNTVVASSLVLKATPGNLYSLAVKIGATTGNVILVDATAAPSNGAVTYKWCKPVLSNGTLGGDDWSWRDPPLNFTVGIVALFSTDPSCAVFTGSVTAQFSGQPK